MIKKERIKEKTSQEVGTAQVLRTQLRNLSSADTIFFPLRGNYLSRSNEGDNLGSEIQGERPSRSPLPTPMKEVGGVR